MDKSFARKIVLTAVIAVIAITAVAAICVRTLRDTPDTPRDTDSSHESTSDSISADSPNSSELNSESRSESTDSLPSGSESEAESETDAPPPSATVKIKKPSHNNEHALFHAFFSEGIEPSVIYDANTDIPYGELIKIEYNGYEDSEYYYIYDENVTLTVSAVPGISWTSGYIDKIMYLTFDDGPSKNSYRVADILKSYNIKATFFTVGKAISARQAELRRLYNDGHVIACHSYSHEYYEIYASGNALSSDIGKWESAVMNALGELPTIKLFRFPGGSNNSYIPSGKIYELLDTVHSCGYSALDWNFGNNDAWLGGMKEGQTIDEYLKQSFSTTLAYSERNVLYRLCLLHETSDATVDMLEWLIELSIEKGYVFRTCDVIGKEILLY